MFPNHLNRINFMCVSRSISLKILIELVIVSESPVFLVFGSSKYSQYFMSSSIFLIMKFTKINEWRVKWFERKRVGLGDGVC